MKEGRDVAAPTSGMPYNPTPVFRQRPATLSLFIAATGSCAASSAGVVEFWNRALRRSMTPSFHFPTPARHAGRRASGALLRGRGVAFREREALGLFAANRAFLDVVFAFAVSHRARNRHAPRPSAKRARC